MADQIQPPLLQATSLDDLWQYTAALNEMHFPDNRLMPIVGGGQSHRPKVMFVFINPTIRNVSSALDWQGPRWPFLGTKPIWRIFEKAGLFDARLLERIEKASEWTPQFAEEVYNSLEQRGFYVTNIVKWTGENADLPDSKKIRLFLPILRREIELVLPEYIVTFGLIPFTYLTGEKLRLGDYYDWIVTYDELCFYAYPIEGRQIRVIPCYFPVGRGDPKRAVTILKRIAELSQAS